MEHRQGASGWRACPAVHTGAVLPAGPAAYGGGRVGRGAAGSSHVLVPAFLAGRRSFRTVDSSCEGHPPNAAPGLRINRWNGPRSTGARRRHRRVCAAVSSNAAEMAILDVAVRAYLRLERGRAHEELNCIGGLRPVSLRSSGIVRMWTVRVQPLGENSEESRISGGVCRLHSEGLPCIGSQALC